MKGQKTLNIATGEAKGAPFRVLWGHPEERKNFLDWRHVDLIRMCEAALMPTAPANPAFRSDAHRRVVMAHIGATLLPSAIAFGILGPLVGLALIWGSTFVALLCTIASTAGASTQSALYQTWETVVAGYANAGVAAAISGIWAGLLSPFVPDRARFLSGAAIIGMMNSFLFVSVDTDAAGIFGGRLFVALTGAVACFLCAWLLQDTVLKRDEVRRDRLAAERASRLARERQAVKA